MTLRGEVMKLIENLYMYPYLGLGNNCNTYFLKDDISTLIDPGHEWNLKNLLRSMKEDGLQTDDIDLIINTHSHPDHSEANQVLADKSGAKISIHELEDEYLQRDGGKVYRMFIAKLPNFRINFYLKNRLNLGEIDLQVIHTPGHSPGSVSLYWQEQKVLICGDLIFFGGIGRADLPGGNAELLKRSIERVSELEIEYLLTGHGRIVKGKGDINRNFDYCLRLMTLLFQS